MKLFGGIALALLAGCTNGPAPGPQTHPGSSQVYLDQHVVQTSLFKFLSETPPVCNSPNITEASRMVNRMKAIHAIWYEASIDESRSNVEQIKRSEGVRNMTPVVLNSMLDLGDAYLKANCTGLADTVYRDLLRAYTGQLYQPYRQRAQVGIEDVRAKCSSGC